MSARSSRQLESRLQATVPKILVWAGASGAKVKVFFLSAKEMKALEKKSGLTKTASHVPNVLSFPEPGNFPHPEEQQRLLGEVYINRELAGGFGGFLYLLIHGILHLVGYSHETKNDILNMEALERKIYEKILKESSAEWPPILLQD